jgi:hypothetical protein
MRSFWSGFAEPPIFPAEPPLFAGSSPETQTFDEKTQGSRTKNRVSERLINARRPKTTGRRFRFSSADIFFQQRELEKKR